MGEPEIRNDHTHQAEVTKQLVLGHLVQQHSVSKSSYKLVCLWHSA